MLLTNPGMGRDNAALVRGDREPSAGLIEGCGQGTPCLLGDPDLSLEKEARI